MTRCEFQRVRRQWLAGLAAALSIAALAPGTARAASVDEAIGELQHSWEVTRYQAPP